MDGKTIVLLVIVLVLLVVVFCLIRKLDKALCSCGSCKCGKHAQDMLDEAVDTLLKLEEIIGVVKRLRYEESCKTALLNEIHSMFFFREFKDPKKMKEHFEKRRASILSGDYVDEEGQVKAQMYDNIIKSICDNWLEPRE